jgi:hypothetical protein
MSDRSSCSDSATLCMFGHHSADSECHTQQQS